MSIIFTDQADHDFSEKKNKKKKSWIQSLKIMVPYGLNIMKEKPVFDWIITAIITQLLDFFNIFFKAPYYPWYCYRKRSFVMIFIF